MESEVVVLSEVEAFPQLALVEFQLVHVIWARSSTVGAVSQRLVCSERLELDEQYLCEARTNRLDHDEQSNRD